MYLLYKSCGFHGFRMPVIGFRFGFHVVFTVFDKTRTFQHVGLNTPSQLHILHPTRGAECPAKPENARNRSSLACAGVREAFVLRTPQLAKASSMAAVLKRKLRSERF